MGIHDRDYYQDERPAGVHLGSQTSVVTKLIIVNVVVYVVDIFMGNELTPMLSASPESLAEPWRLWQTFTYGFAHDPSHVNHIFWNMFGLFVFGRDVENVYGPKEFLRIYLLTMVLGGLLWSARGLAMIPAEFWDHTLLLGASGAVTAITLLFCMHFPKRTILLMFVLPVPAWVVGMMVIVLNVMGVMNPDNQVAFDVHLVGAAFAIAYYKLGWNLSRFSIRVPNPKRMLTPRPKLKLHDPAARTQDDLDATADELLAKVRQKGIESLNEAERRQLEDYSRRMRQKYS
jgi:membrane associated rhomboid family serine protease